MHGAPNISCKAIPHAPELLNEYYWRLAYDFLKPLLTPTINEEEHNLHYYKIISASELTVVAVMPFYNESNDDAVANKKLNAEFAWFIAVSIMLNWKIDGNEIIDFDSLKSVYEKQEIIDVKSGQIIPFGVNFREEHIEWLQSINAAAPLPILSNSQTWRMCFIAAKAINQHTK